MGTKNILGGLLSLITTAVFSISCVHTDPEKPAGPFKWLDGSTDQSVSVDGESQVIRFHLYDESGYTASIEEGSSWAEISGQTPFTIELSLSENLDARREARLVLTSANGGARLSVELSQALSQRGILMKFFESTGGQNWKEKEGWCSGRPLGEWFGVTTGPNGKVIWLVLDGNHLEGTIPEEFYDLTSLRFLSLKNRKALNTMDSSDKDNWNKLSGGISHSIGKMTSLETLYLAGNPLGGEIPDEIWSDHIQDIYLDRCSIIGGISSQISKATSLVDLSLADNNLSGAIPEELCSLPCLAGLELGNVWKNSKDANRFDAIPYNIGNLISLEYLSMPDCGLMGEIPEGLYSLPNLQKVFLDDNSLSGIIEAAWIIQMKSIIKFEVFNNVNLKIRGDVPSCVGCNPAQIIE